MTREVKKSGLEAIFCSRSSVVFLCDLFSDERNDVKDSDLTRRGLLSCGAVRAFGRTQKGEERSLQCSAFQRESAERAAVQR